MYLKLFFGLFRDKNSDGDGALAIATDVAKKYPSSKFDVTLALDQPKPFPYNISRPFIVIAHSLGVHNAIQFLTKCDHQVDLLVCSDGYLLWQDGLMFPKLIKKPIHVERLMAYHQSVGFLHGKGAEIETGVTSRLLSEDPNINDAFEHFMVLLRPDVKKEILDEIDFIAGNFGVHS